MLARVETHLPLKAMKVPALRVRTKSMQSYQRCFVGLRDVFLKNTNSTDLRPLSPLTRLRWLDLSDNSGLVDVSPLSSLLALTGLDLSNTGAARVYLPALTQLKRLILLGTRPSRIAGGGMDVMFDSEDYSSDEADSL
jgi:hypothetical protein